MNNNDLKLLIALMIAILSSKFLIELNNKALEHTFCVEVYPDLSSQITSEQRADLEVAACVVLPLKEN